MRVGLLQLSPVVCDFQGNARKIVEAAQEAFGQGADLCVTPELGIIGYPPRDLLLRRDVLEESKRAVQGVAQGVHGLGPLLVGAPWLKDAQGRAGVYNAACLLIHGRVDQVFGKTLLPEYDVFDELRYFSSFPEPGTFECMDRSIGVTICEDIWNDYQFWHRARYDRDPVQELVSKGADLIINMAASPFARDKHKLRQDMMSFQAERHGIGVLFCNQVGGFDDLVFSGRSTAFDPQGAIRARAREFQEDVLIVDTRDWESNRSQEHSDSLEEVWQALVLGTKDFVRKSGFERVLLGLSGGMDSALTAAVAARALGPEQVTGVIMPSPYSSPESVEHSLELAKNLGINTVTLPIRELMQAYDTALEPVFSGYDPDVTEENIQARIRANLLMAMSNKWGAMLLNTGNKSELAVGYCTIYGDMAGSLAVLADVPKTLVYSLAYWLNNLEGEVFSRDMLGKPPSAELRPDQRDQDSLPEYGLLDEILHLYLERMHSVREICALGYDPDVVKKVAGMVQGSEFKRQQAPPGIRISEAAFGPGRRMPLAARCLWESLRNS